MASNTVYIDMSNHVETVYKHRLECTECHVDVQMQHAGAYA